MTPDLLRQCGEALYGDRWQTALAADLQVTDRTLRRWLSQQYGMPDGLENDLRALIEKRWRLLARVSQLLR